ncbi:hypothetical protein [Sabulicella rubraurantiaca]|uniref:hypothetical protein n=1 Tax=Sabulicella rubraurantiaca TaxID=2811429 RepID=UPI001A97631A|nr:hypothetical protein [Sabulicella rubraurantiaca]
MAVLIRAQNWAATPPGLIERWQVRLRMAVGLMLATPQPACIAWGPALTTLYNDACIALLGTKHPEVLDRPCASAWPEAFAMPRRAIDAMMAGEVQVVADQEVTLAGTADNPARWFTFALDPPPRR